jgi:hypothetical protein
MDTRIINRYVRGGGTYKEPLRISLDEVTIINKTSFRKNLCYHAWCFKFFQLNIKADEKQKWVNMHIIEIILCIISASRPYLWSLHKNSVS